MLKGSEARKGGGYLQRDKKRKLGWEGPEERQHLQQSALAQHMVDTPHPNTIMPLLKSLRSLGRLGLEYLINRMLTHC